MEFDIVVHNEHTFALDGEPIVIGVIPLLSRQIIVTLPDLHPNTACGVCVFIVNPSALNKAKG